MGGEEAPSLFIYVPVPPEGLPRAVGQGGGTGINDGQATCEAEAWEKHIFPGAKVDLTYMQSTS